MRTIKTYFALAAVWALATIVSQTVLPFSNAAEKGESKPVHAPVKMSAFAPADDLVWQFEKTVSDLDRAVATPEAFKDQPKGRFAHDANTLSLVVFALGVHDQPNKVKPHAKAALAALKQLTEAKDYEATKKSVGELKSSMTEKTNGKVEWSKTVPLDALMRDYVPTTNTDLNRDARKLSKRTQQVAAEATSLAVMAENAKLYADDIASTDTEKKWMSCCESMRDAAALVAAKARVNDKDGTAAAIEKLNHSCHECHAVFNPEK